MTIVINLNCAKSIDVMISDVDEPVENLLRVKYEDMARIGGYECLLCCLEGPGSSGKDRLASLLATGLTAFGAKVVTVNEPTLLRDIDGQPVRWKASSGETLNSTDVFKRGILANGGTSEEREYTQLFYALGLRGWLFGTFLPRQLKGGEVVVRVRGDLSTMVYQGLHENGALAPYQNLFLETRQRMGIPTSDTTLVLMPDLPSQQERLKRRLNESVDIDVYDRIKGQKTINAVYRRFANNPDRLAEFGISEATLLVPTVNFGETEDALLFEAMILLYVAASGMLTGAEFASDVHRWVTVQKGSTPQNGKARMKTVPILERAGLNTSAEWKSSVSYGPFEYRKEVGFDDFAWG